MPFTTVTSSGALSSGWIDAMPTGSSRSRSSRTDARLQAGTGDGALAQFMGPRAEQSDLVEQLLVRVLRDHTHWRKNYQPDDPTLIDAFRSRQFEPGNDRLKDALDRMTAELRGGSFPFHSPRYLAHQLSDVSIPTLLGFLTTMLYNPNNVTPEAAPVTTHWKVEACAEVLGMLGFARPPAAVAPDTHSTGGSGAPPSEFGWCHITSGGTLANIEALWVARVVRYFPLAARDVARGYAIPVAVRMPNGTARDLRTLSPIEAVSLRHAEAIQLLPDLVDAVRRSEGIPESQVGRAAEETWRLLRKSPHSPSASTGKMFAEFPPAVFVSGAAHYSVHKAADVLGIGRDNVVLVDVDKQFRIDLRDLERRIRQTAREGRVPLAVVAIAGTTEEGAVDPIHRIVDLRTRLESESNVSFWLHIDAAWGGFLRSLFRMTSADEEQLPLFEAGRKLGIPYEWDLTAWHQRVVEKQARISDGGASREWANLDQHNTVRYCAGLERLLRSGSGARGLTLTPSLQARLDAVDAYTADALEIAWRGRHRDYAKQFRVSWASKEVASAFLAFQKADSITVDPHKLGYLPYPCGTVAFKSDRVRHFILQRAPYITSATHAPGLVDLPPRRHERGSDGQDRCVIDAFAPFTLEGSRPGAAAGALWLASTVLPFTMREHGAVVRESLIGAIELYEWLRRWEHIAMVTGGAPPYRIVPLTATRPDTNIVLFTVTDADSRSLTSMNEMTTEVCRRFSIQVERGDRRASYAQPFFLSSTRLASPNYRYQSVADFLRRAGVDASPDVYREHDIVVLRATVMNPYLRPLVRERRQPVFEQFMKALDDAARAAVTTSRRDREAGRGRSGTGESPAVETSAERTARSR